MKNFLRSIVTFLALVFCVNVGAQIANALPQKIPASDSHFRYDGRFDFSNSNAPIVIWQASRIRIDFSGNAVGLIFDGATGQNFFNAQVDGTNIIVTANEGMPAAPFLLSGFGNGRHHLILFKRSEAAAGTVRFLGIEIAANARTWRPPAPHYKLAMEFIGDSITVGACDEDGASDQWTNRLTHDCAMSYATLTANAFAADDRNIAVSGMGIVTGWVPTRAGEIWDRLYPATNSARANLRAWIPNLVFLNFGENDDSYSRAHGQSFPTNFAAGYVSLVSAIRRAYPAAEIVLLRGGMSGGAQSKPLRLAWENAVKQIEANDPRASHFVFKHWTANHPRVTDDRILADELIVWLKQQKFMQ